MTTLIEKITIYNKNSDIVLISYAFVSHYSLQCRIILKCIIILIFNIFNFEYCDYCILKFDLLKKNVLCKIRYSSILG